MRRRSTVRGLPLVALVVAAGCSSPPASSSEIPEHAGTPVSDPVIEVDDNVFRPDTVTVVAGTEVTWDWVGRIAHNVVGDGFDSGVFVEGSFAHAFDEPGTYPYVCTLHPGMDGEVLVVP
jgi:plastocyanin